MARFLYLPAETQINILEFLPLPDLKNMRLTKKLLNTFCEVLLPKADRREYGYSSIIGNAMYTAYIAREKPKIKREARDVIERERRNGARIDENFPSARIFFEVPKCRGAPDVKFCSLRLFTRAKNLFSISLYLRDKEILQSLLITRLPLSLQVIDLCVLVNVVTPYHAERNIRRLLRPQFKGSDEEVITLPWSEEICSVEVEDTKLHWTDVQLTTLNGPVPDAELAFAKLSPLTSAIVNAKYRMLDYEIRKLLQKADWMEEDATQQITEPDIPLTTLNICFCTSCGKGYLFGWSDWIVEGGKLTGGTMPTDWIMSPLRCGTCPNDSQTFFDELYLREIVQAWVGDFEMASPGMMYIDGAASLLWFEKHFKMYALSSQGLELIKKEDFLLSSDFYFCSNKYYISIEVI